MAKNSIIDYDATADNNEDIGGISILGTAPVRNFDNALRELMAQLSDTVTRRVVKSAGYTALKTDHRQLIEFDSAQTLALTAAATLTDGWMIIVKANGGDVTIDPSGSEEIEGESTYVVKDGLTASVYCDGTGFHVAGTSFNDLSTDTGQAQARSNIGVPLRGHIFGLTLSNNATDAANDIDIAAGEAASDGADPALMVLPSAMTKRLDASWAAGSGNGGLDTGSVANADYNVFLIRNPTSGVVDALFSTSVSAPTMPSGFTQKRRLGTIKRISGSIVGFTQHGDEFLLADVIEDVVATNPGTSAVTRTLSVPGGLAVDALLNCLLRNDGTANFSLPAITSLDQADASPTSSNTNATGSAGAATVEGGARFNAWQQTVRTNTSRQIRTRLAFSDSNVTLRIGVRGWIDTRGRLG